MKNFLSLLLSLFLIISVGCNKESDLGQPVELQDNLLTTIIQLEVSGFNNTSGLLAIAVFDNSNSFESENETYRDSTLAVTHSEMTIVIENVHPGDYAISVFHDEDDNDELNTNIFGIPQEGFGFSNNPSIGFSQPTYNECVFTIEEGVTLIVPIELVHF